MRSSVPATLRHARDRAGARLPHGDVVIPLLAATGHDLEYVLLLALLLLLPRVVQRFGIPAPLTALAIGAGAGPGLGLLAADSVVGLLSTLGIVSIFLLAGLEVDLGELRADGRRIVQHVAVRAALFVACAIAMSSAFGLEGRAGLVASLALLTPSCGFILEALPTMGLFEDEAKAVRNRVISTELLALAMLLFATQSTSWDLLAMSVGVIAAMIVFLPFALRILVAVVVPHAPKSEFAFLVVLAVVCAMVTRELGVYYLVGAFVVGASARRFRESVPAMSSTRILHAVEAFGSVFAPFYFFAAGVALRPADFTWESAAIGAALLVAGCGLRILTALELSVWTSEEGWLAALRKAVPMMPTLVFTLVLAGILRDRFDASPALVGGLVIYAIANTVLPAIVLPRLPVPDSGARLPPWPADLP